MKFKALILTSLALSPFAHACEDIMLSHTYARATPPNAATSAVFSEIMNHSDKDRVIVSAKTEAAGKVELHDVIKEGDIMKMRQVEQITIPAKSMIELKPGSLHIMLFNLKKPLTEGENIDVTLTFANGEKKVVTAPIKKVMSGMKHQHK
ncbi:copper chaperone PCu(A)C [Vibrio pectenicida]|uniref:Copper chaperone PCu(A)C n=1 Tax=Vibrio pectenicida TaxID=62763 RepID=A0A7Y4EDD4_9VIBR|nr:copper chaperone PCu(A)C [Vibrio pectenicida]NOH71585.1 copper chaperone PCu(A)C [Vibrio pectenicida]